MCGSIYEFKRAFQLLFQDKRKHFKCSRGETFLRIKNGGALERESGRTTAVVWNGRMRIVHVCIVKTLFIHCRNMKQTKYKCLYYMMIFWNDNRWNDSRFFRIRTSGWTAVVLSLKWQNEDRVLWKQCLFIVEIWSRENRNVYMMIFWHDNRLVTVVIL